MPPESVTSSGCGQRIDALAECVDGILIGSADQIIEGLQTLDDGGPSELTFIGSAAHAARWPTSRAGAAVVTNGLLPREPDPAGRSLIFVSNADLAMIALLERFQSDDGLLPTGVDPSAVIDATATIAADARIGAHVSIGPRCTIAEGVVIHPGVRLYADVQIGPGCVIHGNVVIREACVLGARVILHQNVSIGADGFGYRLDPTRGGLRKVPHLGNVVLEDDVEIGANSCVDRAKFGSTRIGQGTKIDNLVQVAHNCRIGRHCVIAGACGIAGSVTIGDGVQMGGGTCVADHVQIGSLARIAAMSGVHANVPAGAKVGGIPSQDVGVALRQVLALRRLPALIKRLEALGDGREGGSGGLNA